MSRIYWEPEGDERISYKEKAEKYRAILEGIEFQNLNSILGEEVTTCYMIGQATKKKFLEIVASQFQAMEEAIDKLQDGDIPSGIEVLKDALGAEYKGPGDNGKAL